MPKILYVPKNFTGPSLAIISEADSIMNDYQSQGYDLTLRQLYYQFVSRDLIENTQKSYKRLGSIVNDARMAGLLDWNSIVDRTRNLEELTNWKDPSEIVRGAANGFHVDYWADQEVRIEVWIEKEALAGVFERVCEDLDIPYFCCRGYTSQSEMWRAAIRIRGYERDDKDPIILHFGDHDPSGIDMSRDIEDRLSLFGADIQFERLALNMDQVDEYKPPPNPAKLTDSRCGGYMAEYGDSSWELDALDPATLSALVRKAAASYTDEVAWAKTIEREEEGREVLTEVADRYEEIRDFLRE